MKNSIIAVVTLSFILFVHFGCSSDDSSLAADSETSTQADTGSDIGYICDKKAFGLEPELGRLMLLLDASSSMLDTPTGQSTDKWTQAKTAISNLMNTYKGHGIKFGIDSFPDGSEDGANEYKCGVSNPVIRDTKLDNEDLVKTDINSINTYVATPMYCAMSNFLDENYANDFVTADGNKVLVLIADGGDNCRDDCIYYQGFPDTDFDPSLEFALLAEELLSEMGIQTATIGFGNSGGFKQLLDDIAAAGGTFEDEMIPASDQEELEEALGVLTGLIASCKFGIGEIKDNVDPELVNLFFDDKVVPFDENCTTGFSWKWANEYDTIEFCDEACDEMRQNVSGVMIKFGCALFTE